VLAGQYSSTNCDEQLTFLRERDACVKSSNLKTPDNQSSVNMLITDLQTVIRGGDEDTFLLSLKHNSQQTATPSSELF
jgi:hypothetical protein